MHCNQEKPVTEIQAFEKSKKLWFVSALFLLAGLTLTLYFPARNFEFTNWDDGMYITQNFLIQKVTADRIRKIFTSLIFANYHPVTLLSFALQYAVFGSHPAGYHWVNIILHTANILLVFHLVGQISRSQFLSIATALIFGLHPLQVESVAWVSSHKTLLSGFFSLTALGAYWQFLQSRKSTFYIASLALFIIAVFSKPTAMTLPLVFAGLDRLISPAAKAPGPGQKVFIRVLPHLFFSALALFLVLMAHLKEKAISPLTDRGLAAHSVIPFWSLAIYLKKIFWPVDLIALYPPLSHVGWHQPDYAIPALFIIVVFFYAFAARKQFPFFAACLSGYILLLIPTMNLVPLSTPMADRYLYLPLIFPVLFAGRLIEQSLDKLRGFFRTLLGALIIVTIGSFLFAESRQNLESWRNSFTLWNSVLKKSPRHALAHVKLGESYYEKGNVDEAIRLVSKGVSLGLNNPVFAKNLVAMYIDKGDYALARKSALGFVEQLPGDERFYIQLGIIESKEAVEKAEFYFKKATEINPDNPFAWYQLGRFYLDHQKKPDAAYSCFLKSLAIDPYQADFHIAVADCLSQIGSYPQAINILRYALTLDARSVNAWLNLGNLFKLTGDEASSRQALQKAYELEPSLKPSSKPVRVD